MNRSRPGTLFTFPILKRITPRGPRPDSIPTVLGQSVRDWLDPGEPEVSLTAYQYCDLVTR
jgi:hypothetical protein